MSWAALLGLCAALNAVSPRLRPAPPPLRQGLAAENAVESSALLSLGMRRLAADLGFIRLLIYYGTPEGPDEESEGHHHKPFDPEHPELFWGGGSYPEVAARALRLIDTDPTFAYPVLYASGALAFNLNRPDEALRVLRYALSRDPRNVQYQAYVMAVGLHRHGDKAGVIRILEPVLGESDCPAMIKNMMAYLYVQSGERRKAADLYRLIRDTSRDPHYRRLAEAALKRL